MPTKKKKVKSGSGGLPPSSASSAATDRGKSLYVALVVSKGREVGIARIDGTNLCTVQLSSVLDNQLFSSTIAWLDAARPRAILLPKAAADSVLGARIRELSWHSDELTVCAREFFSSENGSGILERIATSPASLREAQEHHVVMSALMCAVAYVEFTKSVRFQPSSVRIEWETADDTLVIDQISIKHLEVVRNARSGLSSGCASLFGSVNHTQTQVGGRLLRRTLIAPPNDKVSIASRHDAVDALLDDEAMMSGIRSQLKALSFDLDFLLRQFAVVPKKVTQMKARQSVQSAIKMKALLEFLPQLALEIKSENPLLRSIRRTLTLPVFPAMISAIGEVLTAETTYSRRCAEARVQECFAVRAGISGALDVARHDYIACMEAIYAVEAEVIARCASAKLHHTARRGFHLCTPLAGSAGGSDPLPSEAIQAVAKGRKVMWSLPKLASLNVRHTEILGSIYNLTYDTVISLIARLRTIGIRELHGVTHSCALLDMLLSFATHVTMHSTEATPWVRPTFNDSGPLCIAGGRHPVLEHALRRQRGRRLAPGESAAEERRAVPSNFYADRSAALTVITGKNCTGKSTLLRSVALHVILAHAGCFVPATQLNVRLTDRIFTRIGTQDDMAANSSTFFVEMRETAFILSNISERSLVIIDELGRGTCNADGAALAWSVCEHLLNTNAYTLFVTHFHDCAALATMYSRVSNCHMGDFTLKSGPAADTSGYGITLAKQCGFPSDIIADARRIAETLKTKRFRARGDDDDDDDEEMGGSGKDALKKKCLADDREERDVVLHKLLALENATIDAAAMRSYLHSLRIGTRGVRTHVAFLDALATRLRSPDSDRRATLIAPPPPPSRGASASSRKPSVILTATSSPHASSSSSSSSRSSNAVRLEHSSSHHDALDTAAANALTMLANPSANAGGSGRRLQLRRTT